MKTRCRWIMIIALVAGLSTAHALTWDIVPGTVGAGDSAVTPGTGTWDTVTGNWTADGGANNIAWVNGSDAEFTGSGYTVNLASGVTVGGITHAGSGPIYIKALVDNTALTVSGSPTWNLNSRTLNIVGDGVNDTALSMTSGQTLTVTGTNGTLSAGVNPGTDNLGNWSVAGATLDFQSGTLKGNARSVGNFSLVKMAGGSSYIHDRNTTETYTNNWELAGGVVTFDNTSSRAYTLAGVVSGSGTVQAEDMASYSNPLNLFGANTFTGGVVADGTVSESGVSVTNDTGFGAVPAGFDPDNIVLRNLAALRLNGTTINTNRGITLDGGGLIVLTGNSSTYGGKITGTGGLQIGGGTDNFGNTLILTSNTHDYTGDTTIYRGTLQLGIDNAIPTNSLLSIGGANTSRLQMNGFDQTVAGVKTTASNTRDIRNDSPSVATLTIDFPSGFYNYGGNFTGSNSVFVVKNGAGSQQLSKTGASTLLAGATVNGGRLRLSGPILSIANITVNDSGDLAIDSGGASGWQTADVDTLLSSATFNTGSRLTFQGANGDFTYSSVISGPMAIGHNGANNLTLTAANTYTGDTICESGCQITLSGSGSITNSPVIDLEASTSIFDVAGVSGGFSLAAGQKLAGDGVVSGAVTTVASSMLAPGGVDSRGSLDFASDLNISAIAGANAGGLEFEFATNNVDIVVMTNGTLTIGSGLLGFADFTFTDVNGMTNGVYTLFAANSISGSLNVGNLTGNVGTNGATGTLGINGAAIELTVTGGADYTAFGQWAVSYGLSGNDAAEGADPDADHYSNLQEFAFGGNPTNSADAGTVPSYGKAVQGGTNYFKYVYAYRTAANPGVAYTLETTPDLVNIPWTNANYVILGTGVVDADFSTVTNGILLDPNSKYFIQLLLQKQ